MAAINVSSLSSGLTGSSFDWQSFVDQIIEIDRTPIYKLQVEQQTNSDRLAALQVLGKNLTELQAAAKGLNAPGLFTGRTATSTTASSTWRYSASSGATIGTYTFAVSQLATQTTRLGSANIGSGLAGSDINKDTVGSGTTLATLSTGVPITAGTFTINGAQVTVATSDSLEEVFQKIATATGNTVNARYDSATDTFRLESADPGQEVVLGAANDTSNFLSVARLSNNGTGTIASSSSLGVVKTSVPLASARLSGALSGPAVDGAGAGAFKVNGVDIAYNINTDSLSDVITRINASSAGVIASYDTASDRMIVRNKSTGDIGVSLTEASGGLLDAVGLNNTSAGMTTQRGNNALFSINGGGTLSSTSNTLSESATGITGLNVTVTSETSQTISVTSDTSSMKAAIQTFIDKYNLVQTYIDLQTETKAKSGSIVTSPLSNNREVQEWSRTMRTMAFATVSGLSGTVKRLADLGIDFQGSGSQLSIRNSSRLDAALSERPDDVQAFFGKAASGFAANFETFLGKMLGSNGTGTDGNLGSAENFLIKQNSSIDAQIAAIERRLESERSRLMAGFQAMQAAQQQSKTMLDSLNRAFNNNNKNN